MFSPPRLAALALGLLLPACLDVPAAEPDGATESDTGSEGVQDVNGTTGTGRDDDPADDFDDDGGGAAFDLGGGPDEGPKTDSTGTDTTGTGSTGDSGTDSETTDTGASTGTTGEDPSTGTTGDGSSMGG